MSIQNISKTSTVFAKYADSSSLDAFSRLRISNPVAIFDNQFTYDLSPLIFESITSGSGATVTHDATNRNALMTFSSTPTGGAAFMQSYEHIRYQPSKSQLVFITFNMLSAVANVLKFAGYSDGTNGMEFQLNGTTKQFVIYSAGGGGNETVTQANWNLDKLDGTGSSGVTLDISKVQILVLDFQALYVGRVRIGFDIGGVIIYAHQFSHANIDTETYIQTANLPIRCGMTCTGTVSTTMDFICCAVSSEGGLEDTHGYEFSVEGAVTAANGADTHILSIQPKTTFNSIANRVKIEISQIDLTVTGNNPVLWKLCLGQAFTGTSVADANATYSAVQTLTGTLSGTPAIIMDTGYVAASAGTKTATYSDIATKYPITLDRAGAVRDLGRMTVLVQGISGTSATRCSLKWREVR